MKLDTHFLCFFNGGGAALLLISLRFETLKQKHQVGHC